MKSYYHLNFVHCFQDRNHFLQRWHNRRACIYICLLICFSCPMWTRNLLIASSVRSFIIQSNVDALWRISVAFIVATPAILQTLKMSVQPFVPCSNCCVNGNTYLLCRTPAFFLSSSLQRRSIAPSRFQGTMTSTSLLPFPITWTTTHFFHSFLSSSLRFSSIPHSSFSCQSCKFYCVVSFPLRML